MQQLLQPLCARDSITRLFKYYVGNLFEPRERHMMKMQGISKAGFISAKDI